MVVTYFNGKFIDLDDQVIPIEERGHNFGDGIYDVIRAYNGRLFMLEAHLDRIWQSAAGIQLAIGRTRAELKAELLLCFDRLGVENADVYLQITRGIAPRNHLFPADCAASISIIVRPTKEFPMGAKNAVKLLPDERWANCYIKSLNLLPNVLARQTAVAAGYAEAVFVKDGYVTEGSATAAFIVKDGVIIVTPLSKQILPSITRMVVKQIAEKVGIPYEERHFTTAEMKNADEVFIAGTLIEIMGITGVDEIVIGDGTVGEITKKLQTEFFKLV